MKARSDVHGHVVLREMDILMKQDGTDWKVGDIVALDPFTGLWRIVLPEDRWTATITEIVA